MGTSESGTVGVFFPQTFPKSVASYKDKREHEMYILNKLLIMNERTRKLSRTHIPMDSHE